MRLDGHRHSASGEDGLLGAALSYLPLVVGTALTAFLIFVAFSRHADQVTRQRIQDHGVPASGTVRKVTVTHVRRSADDSSTVVVDLVVPTSGVTRTVLPPLKALDRAGRPSSNSTTGRVSGVR